LIPIDYIVKLFWTVSAGYKLNKIQIIAQLDILHL